MSSSFIIKRVLISIVAGLVFGAILSEFTFNFLQETTRPPKIIELTIPNGTAAEVARGETPPSIPDKMTFVVGDILLVHNQDVVDHQLGPLFIPSGSSANLTLGTVETLAYECSFRPDKYFGLEVHDSLTLGTRIYGILYAGLPAGILFALYSILLPSKEKTQA